MRLWGRGTAPRCEGEATKYLSGWVEAEARIRSTEGMRGYDGHDGTLEERLSTALIDDFLVQSQGRSIHPLDTSRAPAPPEALALFGSPRSSFRPYACLDPSSLSTCRQFQKTYSLPHPCSLSFLELCIKSVSTSTSSSRP